MAVIAPLVSAILPFLLWPVEFILPYPSVIEELAKGTVVYLILRVHTRIQLKLVILSALLFSLSETVLYLFNIYLTGNLYILGLRLTATTFMHLTTFLIIFAAGKINIKLLPLGVLLAIFLHQLFNSSLAQ